ncbi:MAG: hypothetical protein GX567_03945 [Clostridia bacterium]|nr:hypothetical protein [Clostridia bacterium]
MENATKAILFGAAIVITLVLVSLGFVLLNKATGSVDQQLSDMDQQQQKIMDQKYTKYDGITVTGAEVLNALESFKDGEIAIKVITIKTTSTYYYSLTSSGDLATTGAFSADYSKAKDKTDNNYINPSGKFEGAIIRDKNQTITGIQFTQIVSATPTP